MFLLFCRFKGVRSSYIVSDVLDDIRCCCCCCLQLRHAMQNDRRAATYLLITAALWYLRSTITQSVSQRLRVIVAIRVDGAELELELNIVGNGISKVVKTWRRKEGLSYL